MKSGFNSIPPDNDIQYLNYLFQVVEKVDDNAEIKIDRKDSYYNISVLIDNLSLRNVMIEDIKFAHEVIGLNIEFSKSLAISNYISWSIR